MRYTKQLHPGGPKFSWHYIRRVREGALGGMVSSAEIAQVLRRVDHRITTSDVTRWRRENPEFDHVCQCALDEANEAVANVLYEAAASGDIAAARYWSDRRNPAFMPKNKSMVEHSGEQLDDMLKRRAVSDAELLAAGVLQSRQPAEFDDGDSY